MLPTTRPSFPVSLFMSKLLPARHGQRDAADAVPGEANRAT
jgi:hypothetical protein